MPRRSTLSTTSIQQISDSQVIGEFRPDLVAAHTVPTDQPFLVETRDALDGAVIHGLTERPRVARPNPATGPIAIAGARPGQALAVDVLAIDVAEEGYLTRTPAPTFIPQRGGLVEFVHGLRLPLAPMIGTIGVAPTEGVHSTKVPGRHGGNLDTRDVAPGAVLYLRVAQPGALLALGDVHSLQADGESSGQGIETAARVLLRARLLEDSLSEWPYLVRDGELMVLVSAETLDEAAREATEEMARLIVERSALSPDEARMLLGLVGDLRIGQVVNPLKTVRVAVPLEAVPWSAPLPL